MSVALICPRCGTPATIHRAPVGLCPSCRNPWPEALGLSAEAALARQKATRPLLLTLSMYTAAAFGGFLLFLLCLALFNAASYTINREPVTGLEFVERVGPRFAVLGISCLAIAYAIWREYPWNRWAIVAFWTVQVVGAVGSGWSAGGLRGAVDSMASLLTVLVVVGWYLFGKENVVAYYRSLEQERAARNARRASRRSDGSQCPA
jgi:hypothetical protein